MPARRRRAAACRAAALAGALATLLAPALAGAELPAARRGELEVLLRHDCGACHGLYLTGGLGPPITARALAARSDATLTAVIARGLPGTAMPPWGPLLTEAEIAWLVRRLRDASAGGAGR